MTIAIPDDAGEFFERFLPEQFLRERHRYPGADSPGAALFEIIDVGWWGIKIENGELAVRRGKPDDTMLRVTLPEEDFRAVFVERTRREIDASGDLSDDSRDAFKPLFVDANKAGVIAGSIADAGQTLAVYLRDDGAKRELLITPGPGERTEPRASITMSLGDFLAMVGGRKNPVMLFLRGKLKIRGDLTYAMRMKALLS
ncbi:MAG: SCP2 sterol-binding domain-containing protein [Candidatus Binatia bacterium]